MSKSAEDGVHVNVAFVNDQGNVDQLGKGNSDLVQRVTYTWENIQVSTDVTEGNFFSRLRGKATTTKKLILNQVSGVVRPGEFLAIMGASGAGKTTLLNCLTLRNTGKLTVSGQRRINGLAVDSDLMGQLSGYVQQEDLFVGSLTVKEHLRFQALLRMDKHIKFDDRIERVERVIMELGLVKCANTMIGDPAKGVKGISGGERKRLAFASEVLTDPPLMFCDEPTSGLDSYMAQNIVEVLQGLASRGKTVICTIHQPSSEVFALFDRILLMAEGRTAFLGPLDQALDFFASQGYVCPASFNPADFYVYNLATLPGAEAESRQKIQKVCDAFEASSYGSNVRDLMKIHQNPASDASQAPQIPMKGRRSPYKASWTSQFSAVFWRSFISIIKDPRVTIVKGISALFFGLVVTLIYQGQDQTEDVNAYIQNIQGVLFLFITNSTFGNVFGVVNTFAAEVPIFLREHFNGMYRTDVYFLSKTLVEVPLYIIFPMISWTIPYFAIGLNAAADRFFIGAALVILVNNVAVSFGYMVSCLASSVAVATALGAPLILPALIFGGSFINNSLVPIYLDWLRYLSWFMYSNEALSINQWSGFKFDACLGNTNSTNNQLCTGQEVLDRLSFDESFLVRDILGLVALLVGFRLVAFLALLLKTYRKN